MKYEVFIISDAEQDLIDIYSYIATHHSTERAENLFSQIESVCFSLDHMPERGHIPPELDRIGIRDYREIHCKVYRIIYQILNNSVFIHCIIDGRRDIQSILPERLLR